MSLFAVVSSSYAVVKKVINAQKEFLSYPKGKHDDIMDSVWTALDGAKPCRRTDFALLSEDELNKQKKTLDWMTM